MTRHDVYERAILVVARFVKRPINPEEEMELRDLVSWVFEQGYVFGKATERHFREEYCKNGE